MVLSVLQCVGPRAGLADDLNVEQFTFSLLDHQIVNRMNRKTYILTIIIYTTQYIPSYFSNPAVAVTVSNPAKMATFLMTFMTQHSEELVKVVYFTDQPS